MKCQITCHGRTETADAHPMESLLETAVKLNLAPPYSCLEGICGTCEARVQQGVVLSSDGITLSAPNSGGNLVVKTCLTRPKSDVVITYDNL